MLCRRARLLGPDHRGPPAAVPDREHPQRPGSPQPPADDVVPRCADRRRGEVFGTSTSPTRVGRGVHRPRRATGDRPGRGCRHRHRQRPPVRAGASPRRDVDRGPRDRVGGRRRRRGDAALQLVADRACELAAADLATIALPIGPDELTIEIVAGSAASELLGRASRSPAASRARWSVTATGRARRCRRRTAGRPTTGRDRQIGPAVWVPLTANGKPAGTLVGGPIRGCIAVHRGGGRARAAVRRRTPASSSRSIGAVSDAAAGLDPRGPGADRPRPARHGDPTALRHRAVAAGRRPPDGRAGNGRGSWPPSTTSTTRSVRSARSSSGWSGRPRRARRAAGHASSRCAPRPPELGFDPTVRFDGPMDTAVPSTSPTTSSPSLREALANVGRHAAARAVRVDVAARGGDSSRLS